MDRQFVEVTGTGQDSNYWHNNQYSFKPGSLYHFHMRARRTSGSGCALTGPSFANRDRSDLSAEWKWYDHVFRMPEHTEGAHLRLGQWHARGTVQFDAVRLCPTLPVHRVVGNVTLGDGESLRDGRYRFLGTFGHQGSNHHRTLVSATASFNSDRWCFGGAYQVTYRFAMPDCRFLSGRIGFNVNYHTRGGCVAEVSSDQANWTTVATQEGLGNQEAKLPDGMLPAETVFLRLRTASNGSSFQVNRIEFDGALQLAKGTASQATLLSSFSGSTSFADLQSVCPDLEIREMTLHEAGAGEHVQLQVTVQNTSPKRVAATFDVGLAAPNETHQTLPKQRRDIAAGERATFAVDLTAREPGEHQVTLTLSAGSERPAISTLSVTVPEYYRTDYGELLSGEGDPVLWWCDATRKIPRQRRAPKVAGTAARLSAAKNDREAVQIVLRPRKTLKGLTATARVAGDSKGLNDDDIQVLRVFYHFVDHPTDRTGVRDYWPDALPPLSEPIDVPAGQNQPLWVLVHVPQNADAGDYDIELALNAEGWSATVPIRLHVWDFTLPKRNHVETAFGLSVGNIFRYHQVKSEADKRRVLDLYFKNFSEHRISPYDPTPLDPIRVTFLPKSQPPRAELDFSAFDAAMTRAVESYHFTGIRLPVQGMGGGTFHARYEPKLEGFAEQTPQYQAMFSNYVKQLEQHFKAKGWLDMAYIYWFDEPDPKDYQFVTNGMERLRESAPGLRRMLTEEPNTELAAPVNIWCPVSSNYDHKVAEEHRQPGVKFWWYVCTGPKAPYCTLFLDHPATELRVWLWQTWQRNIGGILVWQSNYWTSSAAFPDSAQDPYEDPMGYVSGYSTPRGVKRFWGNGDGRFVYPPLAAAKPGASGAEPIFDAPVSSIRWEMLREGIEDYESLYLLRELLNQHRHRLTKKQVQEYEALLVVPESITKDMTTFAKDPIAIYTHRAAVAHAIEQLHARE